MGNPKNKESCPYGDNACFESGKTPKILWVTISGVTVPSWVTGGSPNGRHRCQQVSTTRWVSTGVHRCAVVLKSDSLDISVYNILNQPVFYGYEDGDCLRSLVGLKTAYNTAPGAASFGYEGP